MLHHGGGGILAQARPHTSAALAVLAALGGCTTPNRPFRTTTTPAVASREALRDPERRAAIASTSLERYDGFTIGIVEFDDQGRFWDRHQLDALEGEILSQAGGPDDPGVLLSVFVHGWRHDADVCDANLACFRELARRIALDQRAAAASAGGARPRPVIGVYVGWRGLSKKVWPLEQLSFVSRKNAALRVGSGDMTELLTRLDRMRVELNAAKKDASRLVVLGHSLGGTVVFEALANIFKNRLADVWPGVDVDGSSKLIPGFGDLVVLVNPAFEAERWRPIDELASTYAGFSKRQRPVLVVVGSETDSATKMWFPFGQWVATVFEKTRDAEERKALRTSIGNYLRSSPIVSRARTCLQGRMGRTRPRPASRDASASCPAVRSRWTTCARCSRRPPRRARRRRRGRTRAGVRPPAGPSASSAR